jgi:hypothetical protein
MFNTLRKRFALRQYATKLPGLLRHEYGRASPMAPYTSAQVQRTIERHGLNRTYIAYAVAMFSGAQGFEEYAAVSGCKHRYVELRADITGTYLGSYSHSSSFSECGWSPDVCSSGHYDGGSPGCDDAGHH